LELGGQFDRFFHSDTQELDIVNLDDVKLSLEGEIDQKYIDTITDQDWKIAQERYAIIKPVLDFEKENRLDISKVTFIKTIAEEHEIGYVSIYRWLNIYNSTSLISSLIPNRSSGGRGQSRLDSIIEKIINETIKDSYLTSQKKSKKKTAEEVLRRCKNAEINPPHVNTIYNRIRSLDKKYVLNKRIGYLETSQKVDPVPGKYTEAKYPLDIIQIDHTELDIMVVSEENRCAISRPYITLAIDVYSRMVAGLYISLDSPGSIGTGMCLSNSILPKDNICEKFDLKAEWPIWGVMQALHMDNAIEFKSNMLIKAAQEYGIIINWRPKGKARFGGHIERLLGTLSKQIHALPGTTFNDTKFRQNYNSEAKATMTLSELEKWLHIQIVDIYHQNKHKGIGTSPILKYTEGIFGSANQEGIGLPLLNFDSEKIRMDFLPYFERTIQRTGVVIDHINYYSDIFKNYLYEKVWNASDSYVKNLRSQKYIFKRDPRDISRLYFLDIVEKKYYVIPYADISKPPISIWEYREALNKSKEYYPKNQLTENMIFDALNRLKEIEDNSISAKKIAKRNETKKKSEEFQKLIGLDKVKEEINPLESQISYDDIVLFDVDDEL
jgi:putative transposase